MRPRAVIFDVYQTLLAIGPPPADPEPRWRALLAAAGIAPPPLDHAAFVAATARAVARHHAAARATGIRWPEVVWPAVAAEALPALATLPPAVRDEALYQESGLRRQVRLAAGAADCLRALAGRGVLLGIASNAQAYTLRELSTALGAAGLDLRLFDPALCFWSFEHGFAKPDPHAFRILAARLLARGIAGPAVLMVGDRPDNDLAPARAQGWTAWHLTDTPRPGSPGGPFAALVKALGGA